MPRQHEWAMHQAHAGRRSAVLGLRACEVARADVLGWLYTEAMGWQELLDQVEYWQYRAGAYVLLHLLDEPAWLALLFC